MVASVLLVLLVVVVVVVTMMTMLVVVVPAGVRGEGCIGQDQTLRARENKLCSHYNRRTCCDFGDSGFADKRDILTQETLDEEAPCFVSRGCLDQLNYVTCAICSPDSDTIFGDGVLRVCQPFADRLWQACRTSEVLKVGNNCKRIEEDYKDPKAFVDGFLSNAVYVDDNGGAQGEDCLNAATRGAPSALATLAAVGLAALVVAAL